MKEIIFFSEQVVNICILRNSILKHVHRMKESSRSLTNILYICIYIHMYESTFVYVCPCFTYLYAKHVKQKYQPEQGSFVIASYRLRRKWSCTCTLLMKCVLSLSRGIDGFLLLELYGVGEQQFWCRITSILSLSLGFCMEKHDVTRESGFAWYDLGVNVLTSWHSPLPPHPSPASYYSAQR
jgi:uncharacterized membrane protein